MSKVSPLTQSVAALFQDRKEITAKPARAPAGFNAPSHQGLTSGGSQDSLGNPNSQGYDGGGPRKKKPDGGAPAGAPKAENGSTNAQPTTIETPTLGPQFIRLGIGWEKLLVAQRKICEKAKSLFIALEGPGKYGSLRKSRTLLMKSRGCILDLDSQAEFDEKADDKEKKTA